jgi:hypothetical protein
VQENCDWLFEGYFLSRWFVYLDQVDISAQNIFINGGGAIEYVCIQSV